MKYLLFAFAVLLSAANAFAMPSELVVKVKSASCKSRRNELLGSGLLFQAQGAAYVVTSEHVVFHGAQGFCHRAQNDVLGEIKLDLVDADWGKGLALLKVSARSLPLVPKSLDEIFAPADRSAVTTIAGFPVDLNSMLVDSNGHMVVEQSRRHLFAEQDTVYEFSGVRGEFGMSGGPIFQGERAIGLLSHQLVELNPGHASVIKEITASQEGDSVRNNLFVIPAANVKAWILERLGGVRARMVRDSQAQLEGVEAVLVNGVRLNLVKNPNYREASVRPFLLARGGGDGVGAGGDASVSLENAVLLELVNPAELQRNRIGVLSRLQAILQLRSQVLVSYFIEADGSSLSRTGVGSLARFVRSIQDRGLLPMVTKPNGESFDADSSSALAAAGVRVSEAAKRVGANAGLSVNERKFLSDIETIAEWMQSDMAAALTPEILNSIVSPHAADKLYTIDFDGTVALMAEVEKAKTLLSRTR